LLILGGFSFVHFYYDVFIKSGARGSRELL